MLGLAQLEKLLDQRRYGAVIDRCLDSGGLLPLELRLAVESEERSECAATALAFSRSLELTRRVTPCAERFASELLALKTADGLFDQRGRPLCTALCLAALGSFVQISERTLCDRMRSTASNALLEEAREAIRGVIDRLRSDAAVSEDGLVTDATTTAFLLVCASRVPGLLDAGFASSLSEALIVSGAMHERHTARMLRHAVALLGAGSIDQPTPAAA